MHTVTIKVHGDQVLHLSREINGIMQTRDVNIHNLQALVIGDDNKIIDFTLNSDPSLIDFTKHGKDSNGQEE